MEVCAGMELRNTKRKRYAQDSDDCIPAKRKLTEESMAAFMDQLNLTSVDPTTPHSLNITTINTTCPASVSTIVEATILTPPRTSLSPQKPQKLVGSSVTDGLALAIPITMAIAADNSVHIRVTPATPPLSESSLSPCQEDCEPMEDLPLSCLYAKPRATGKKKDGVILEDVSSDSSDNEMTQRQTVWIAPELQSLTASSSQRHLFPPSLLDEIIKKDMAVVPWVSREQYFNNVISRSHEEISSSESEDDDNNKRLPTQPHDGYWDCSMD